MSDPIKCCAVTSGEYSGYEVHAIYRRREDAQARVDANNSAPKWVLDGVPIDDRVFEDEESGRRVESNPAREEIEDMRVEEFDYYEGEPRDEIDKLLDDKPKLYRNKHEILQAIEQLEGLGNDEELYGAASALRWMLDESPPFWGEPDYGDPPRR